MTAVIQQQATTNLQTQAIAIGQESKKFFAFSKDYAENYPSPWKAAFPERGMMGYARMFSRECERLFGSTSHGIVEEKTAKTVWLSILEEYEKYSRSGIWLPEQLLQEHKLVARMLGWL